MISTDFQLNELNIAKDLMFSHRKRHSKRRCMQNSESPQSKINQEH